MLAERSQAYINCRKTNSYNTQREQISGDLGYAKNRQ